MNESEARPSWWRRRNWWKIGFFIMLVLFEFTREIAVIAGDPPPRVATSQYVGTTLGYTLAKGRWARIDGGGKLLPGATSIQCDEEKAQCVEATASMFDGYVSDPDVSTYDAKFTTDQISYENADPICARYNVRVDLKLKKVFAVRERKPFNPKFPQCKNLEPRIEMTLADGYQRDEEPFGTHFVPMLRSIGWLLH